MAIRLIVVDDQPEVRAVLRRTLQRDGRFDLVAEGEDGSEAVALAKAHAPDVILLDLAMPNMNGLDALSEIGNESPLTKIVIFSSMAPFSDFALKAKRLGADAVLDKHTSPKVVVKTIIELLQESDADPEADS